MLNSVLANASTNADRMRETFENCFPLLAGGKRGRFAKVSLIDLDQILIFG